MGYEDLSNERKELIAKGKLPEWFITPGWSMFKEKYLWTDSPLEQYRAIASTAAKYFKGKEREMEDIFFNLMWSGKFSPPTPMLSNMGRGKAMPVSCSGQAISDSIHGFYAARLEAAVLTQNGFGTSGYFGDIRPRGSDISGGGKASGTMPAMIGFTQDMQLVRQGTRRGAFGGYLPITHGDFDEWADKLHHDGDKMNVGWVITDKFIESLNKGDEEAVRRYKKALFVKAITGKGYFFFVDKVNRHSPPSYKDNDLKVKASNLCVAPETMILTDEGYKEIQSVAGTKVNVWNGVEWSNVEVVKTGDNQKLLKVTTKQGHTLECTEYHKWYVVVGDDIVEKRTIDLVPGDRLIKFEAPVIPNHPDSIPNHPDGHIEIKRVKDTGRTDGVYCFTEPKRHMGVFNGILTGQCSEIALYSDEEHTFSCILGAINLTMWPSVTGDDIYYSTFLVHAAGLEFLRIAEGMPGMEKVINFTKKSMALGIGQMGLHTLFQMENLPIDSLDAMFLNRTISETIQYHTHRASGDLAKIFGEPEWCKGTGKANTHLTACMPTKSTSLVLGGVSEGINPDAALVFNQAYSGGEIKRVTPVFLQLLKKKGLYNNDILSRIKAQSGSIQNMGEFTPEEKLVFRTAFEIDQMVLLRLAAQRQAYVDQSQSINLFFSGNASEKYFSAVHKKAFEDEMIHSLYYVYSTTGVYEQEGECTACQ